TVSVELDPLTASFAAANLADFSGSRVVVGDVTNFDPESFRDDTGEAVQGIWLDPARRDLTGVVKSRTERIFDPEAYSPPLSFVVDLARTGMPMGVKLGPGMPHEAIARPEDIRSEANPHPRVTAQWVEHEGSLVELVLWFNALAQEGVARTVTVLRQGAEDGGLRIHKTTLSSPHSAEQVTPVEQEQTRLPSPGEYLYEPSGAVVRAHLVQELSQELGANLIDPHLAYLTAAKAVQSPLAQCYEILEEIPVQEKQLKKWVRERGFTALTIKKRGVDLVPEKLRASLLAGGAGKKAAKNQGYNPATLVFTRVGSGQQARRIGWHVRPVDFSDAAHVSASDTKSSLV
ncbi:MAG: class I SAM-dependent methyltransferase, partial [Rothia dentocariosa]